MTTAPQLQVADTCATSGLDEVLCQAARCDPSELAHVSKHKRPSVVFTDFFVWQPFFP